MKKKTLSFFLLMAIVGFIFLHMATSLQAHQHTGFLEHINCSISDHTFILDNIGLSTHSLLPPIGFILPEPIILREQEVVLSLFMPP